MSYAQPDPPAGTRLTWSTRFARRTALGGSELTAILALVGSPDTITFSGGFPAAETFPVAALHQIVDELLQRDAAVTLQYTPTEGLASSRVAVAELVAATQGTRPEPSGVLVTSGGIEALELLSRVFVEPGDVVAVEAPTYLGALMAFSGAEATVMGVPMDEDGLQVDELERRLAGGGPAPKLCYVIPDHQNPTGLSLSLERRRALVELCRHHGVLIVEDVAYRELGFDGSPLPSLWSLDPESVVQIGTFSKILFPGVRLGWAIGPPEVTAAMSGAKQNSDQCSGALGQRIMVEFVRDGRFPAHLAAARALYERRATAMLGALERHMPEGTTWTRPQGGFFVWVTAPGADVVAMAAKADRERVAFVPGSPFYADDQGVDQARLAYSGVPEDRITEGVRRFARLLRQELDGRAGAAARRREEMGTRT